MHEAAPPSPWVHRWSHLVPAGATLLDLACGSGRHVRWFAGRGVRVTGIDRDEAAVAPLRGLAEIVVADLENGPWPLTGRRFDAVVVTNYLWRARLPQLLDCVAEGGWLIYETFSAGHEALGRPSRPDFLLRPGELLAACAGWRIAGYEEGLLGDPPRCVQRIAARREAVAAGPAPPLHEAAACGR